MLASLLLVTACDSGDKTDSAPEEVENSPPVANAGSDISQPADQTVDLDGHSSYDPDGDPLTYHWSFEHLPDDSTLLEMEAPLTRNDSADAVSTSFNPDVVGTYVLALMVKDGQADSALDYMVVVAEDPEAYPVADAGDDQVLVIGTTVSLDGSGSYDPHGRSLTYSWSLVDTPEASSLSAASISGADTSTASFVPDTKGAYIANLVVNNGLIDSLPDAAVVTVTDENGAPTAFAGEDIETEDCTAIPLDATGSVDPDGDALSYFWELQQKPKESVANNDSFEDRNAGSTTLWADVAGYYEVSVSVSDGEEWSVPDVVNITVEERSFNSNPSVDAGSDVSYDGGEVDCVLDGYTYECDACSDVSLDLGDTATVSDPDGDPVTYAWTVTEGSATISDSSSLVTTVVLSDIITESLKCEENVYIFELSVTDCVGATVTDSIEFVATCCGTKDKTKKKGE